MEHHHLAIVALFCMLTVAGCTVGYQPQPISDSPSEIPSEEVEELGKVDGYWFNATLDIDPADGLTNTEKEAIVSRSMARVQLLRGLPFKERPDVELMTREQFQEEYATVLTENRSGPDQTFENVQYHAMFLVGPERDVSEIRAENRQDSVLGFYDPSDKRIVVVSDSDDPTLHDELTLAHELLHALQDQHFGLESRVHRTTDNQNAYLGLIEGDAVYVERQYEEWCEQEVWHCVESNVSVETTLPDNFHFGVYLHSFFPYAEGPSFIEYHHNFGGWEQVNSLYNSPPSTSYEIIRPKQYSQMDRNNTITDRNTTYTRVEPARISYGVIGAAGITSMFAYTIYDDSNPSSVIDSDEFLNQDPEGGLDTLRPLTYDIPYATGWEADRFHVYENQHNTGYVWKVEWNDAENASQFKAGYLELLRYWNGTPKETGENEQIWYLSDDNEFSKTLWIQRTSSTITIVAAPSSDDLENVYGPAG